MRILLVEDERQIRQLLNDFLGAEGHEVTQGADGLQGWNEFSHNPGGFDLVVADMKMPALDGLSLLKRVRDGGYTTPGILMTGNADVEADGEGLPAGVEVVHKPFDLNEMLKTVARLGGKG